MPRPADPFLAAARVRPDMTCRQVAILNVVVAEPGLSTMAYAGALELPKPVITRATGALADIGLVQSVPDARDRRRVILTPTAEGKKLSASLLQVPA